MKKTIPIILIVSFFISCKCFGQSLIKGKLDTVITFDGNLVQPQDSAKLYWKKKVYWEGRMNKELERLNRTGHKNDISKALVRYQDSSIRYKLLLDKLKK